MLNIRFQMHGSWGIALSDNRFPTTEIAIRGGPKGSTLDQIDQKIEPAHWQYQPDHAQKIYHFRTSSPSLTNS